MKKFIFFSLLAGFTAFTKAQVVNIPDVNFKNALLAHNPVIDTNNDGEIQISEATAFTGTINVPFKNISNLTGIEAFVNITKLYCYHNQLTSLNISQNTAVVELDCGENNLTNLDVSQNTFLTDILCYWNQLTSLDTGNNTHLKYIVCDGNQLTSLNLKNGNNTAMTVMWVYDNPNLTCIQVDNVAYSNINWTGSNFKKDAVASYSTDCSALATQEVQNTNINIYPNPVKDILHFSEEVSNVKITDVSGRMMKEISAKGNSVNVSNLAKGVYMITAVTKSGETVIKKMIKE